MNNSALEIHGLYKRFGRRVALDGLDLTVLKGSLFGLVGSNGAGKTTMMSICAGLLHADDGTINILGGGPHDPARRKGVVTILPQDARLPLHARVGELLEYYGRLQGVPENLLDEEVIRLLALVNLLDRQHAAVRTLSHGMMRRLTVAQAFLGNPELIFLDEPMSGLDPREATRIRDILMNRHLNQTIVISSHILGELESICDHVAFVEKGKRIKQGSMTSIMNRHHRFEYQVKARSLPQDALKAIAHECTWQFDEPAGRIVMMLDSAEKDPEEVNGKVLRILLDAGVGIQEVRRGSDLESEFLSATEVPHKSGS